MTGSRERKRDQRRKRKRRATERSGEPGGDAAVASASAGEPAGSGDHGPEAGGESLQQRMSRRSEQRNQAVREGLEPLAAGERPTAVTVGAVVSAVLAIVLIVSTVLAAAGVEVDGESPRAVPIALFAIVVVAMTWGLWKARYWAVLGFQLLLALVLLASALGLVQVTTLPEAVATLGLLAGSGTLFYFMIRAMARIQMPARPGEKPARPGER